MTVTTEPGAAQFSPWFRFFLDLQMNVILQIDLKSEKLLRLSRAAREYPGGGKHVSQLHRYRQDQRVPLECVKVGGIWMTSVEAMHRHVLALTAASNAQPASCSSHLRQREIAQAEKVLDGVQAR